MSSGPGASPPPNAHEDPPPGDREKAKNATLKDLADISRNAGNEIFETDNPEQTNGFVSSARVDCNQNRSERTESDGLHLIGTVSSATPDIPRNADDQTTADADSEQTNGFVSSLRVERNQNRSKRSQTEGLPLSGTVLTALPKDMLRNAEVPTLKNSDPEQMNGFASSLRVERNQNRGERTQTERLPLSETTVTPTTQPDACLAAFTQSKATLPCRTCQTLGSCHSDGAAQQRRRIRCSQCNATEYMDKALDRVGIIIASPVTGKRRISDRSPQTTKSLPKKILSFFAPLQLPDDETRQSAKVSRNHIDLTPAQLDAVPTTTAHSLTTLPDTVQCAPTQSNNMDPTPPATRAPLPPVIAPAVWADEVEDPVEAPNSPPAQPMETDTTSAPQLAPQLANMSQTDLLKLVLHQQETIVTLTDAVTKLAEEVSLLRKEIASSPHLPVVPSGKLPARPAPRPQETPAKPVSVTPVSTDPKTAPARPTFAEICSRFPEGSREAAATALQKLHATSRPSKPAAAVRIYARLAYRGPIKELRSLLESLNINVRRIVEVSFPARNVIEFLVQDYYADTFRRRLREVSIALLPDFDPLVPLNPNPTDADRLRAKTLTAQRIGRILARTISPLVYSTYRNYLTQHCLLTHLPEETRKRLADQSPSLYLEENRRRRNDQSTSTKSPSKPTSRPPVANTAASPSNATTPDALPQTTPTQDVPTPLALPNSTDTPDGTASTAPQGAQPTLPSIPQSPQTTAMDVDSPVLVSNEEPSAVGPSTLQ